MRTTGRPRATSREVIAEAASELFLEQGFAETTVVEITRRAGVSRSSFFNYFGSKADVLWAGFDERVAALAASLEADESVEAAAAVTHALHALGEGLAPDSLALALVHADAMGLADELERESGVRLSRIGAIVAARLARRAASEDRPTDPLADQVAGAAHAGAVLAAIREWSQAGAGRAPLEQFLDRALAAAAPTLG